MAGYHPLLVNDNAFAEFMKPFLELDTASRVIWTAVAVVLIPCIGILDLISSAEFTFSLFYLVPVVILAWVHGAAGGVAASVATGGLWLYVDFVTDRYSYSVAAYLWNFFSRLMIQTLLSTLVAVLRSLLHRQYRLARIDPLTGVQNRRAFHEAAALEISRARRYGRPLTMAYFDLDNFKAVNDLAGHAAGDELLRRFAGALSSQVRASDIVARLSGDEFAVLFAECDAEAAKAAVQKIRDAASATFADRYPVTVSVGAVAYRLPPPSVDSLLEQADRLMYQVKSAGKNAVRLVVA